MQTEILTLDYKDRVVGLLKNRQKFSKQDNQDSVLDNLIARTEYALTEGNRDRIIGAVENNELVAILAQSFSTTIPIWIMQYYATKTNNILIGKGYGAGLESCFAKAMADAEVIGIYDFWWSVPLQYAKNGPRMQKYSPNWIRYEVYTDVVVPANEFPKYEIHTQAYGKIPKPHSVFIRHAVCKQEFRSVPLTR
jgi:hypothetical protein